MYISQYLVGAFFGAVGMGLLLFTTAMFVTARKKGPKQ